MELDFEHGFEADLEDVEAIGGEEEVEDEINNKTRVGVRSFSKATVAILRSYHRKGMVGTGNLYSCTIAASAAETGLTEEQVKVCNGSNLKILIIKVPMLC